MVPRRRLHMPSRHARFSPSSADRYIHCTPSLRLGEEHGPPDTGSVYTAEGTEAHELGEFLLRTALGETMDDPRPSMTYYCDEMQECAEGYLRALPPRGVHWQSLWLRAEASRNDPHVSKSGEGGSH